LFVCFIFYFGGIAMRFSFRFLKNAGLIEMEITLSIEVLS